MTEKPSIEIKDPAPLDVISKAKEAHVFNFNQQNNYSLSELPPLQQLDDCSDETRTFIMEAYKKEQDFRHQEISGHRADEFILKSDKLEIVQKQKMIGAILAAIIIIGFFIWSLILILNGQTIVGLAPLLIALATLISAAIWGTTENKKVSNNAEEVEEDPTPEDS